MAKRLAAYEHGRIVGAVCFVLNGVKAVLERKREPLQLQTIGVRVRHHGVIIVPITYHHAHGRLAAAGVLMMCRSVGVAVNQRVDSVPSKRISYGLVVNVHDGLRFIGAGRFTGVA